MGSSLAINGLLLHPQSRGDAFILPESDPNFGQGVIDTIKGKRALEAQQAKERDARITKNITDYGQIEYPKEYSDFQFEDSQKIIQKAASGADERELAMDRAKYSARNKKMQNTFTTFDGANKMVIQNKDLYVPEIQEILNNEWIDPKTGKAKDPDEVDLTKAVSIPNDPKNWNIQNRMNNIVKDMPEYSKRFVQRKAKQNGIDEVTQETIMSSKIYKLDVDGKPAIDPITGNKIYQINDSTAYMLMEEEPQFAAMAEYWRQKQGYPDETEGRLQAAKDLMMGKDEIKETVKESIYKPTRPKEKGKGEDVEEIKKKFTDKTTRYATRQTKEGAKDINQFVRETFALDPLTKGQEEIQIPTGDFMYNAGDGSRVDKSKKSLTVRPVEIRYALNAKDEKGQNRNVSPESEDEQIWAALYDLDSKFQPYIFASEENTIGGMKKKTDYMISFRDSARPKLKEKFNAPEEVIDKRNDELNQGLEQIRIKYANLPPVELERELRRLNPKMSDKQITKIATDLISRYYE